MDYNFAYLDEQTKRMIRRAILKGLAIPGYQVPFSSREMPMPYGWGTGGVQVSASILTPMIQLTLYPFASFLRKRQRYQQPKILKKLLLFRHAIEYQNNR